MENLDDSVEEYNLEDLGGVSVEITALNYKYISKCTKIEVKQRKIRIEYIPQTKILPSHIKMNVSTMGDSLKEYTRTSILLKKNIYNKISTIGL